MDLIFLISFAVTWMQVCADVAPEVLKHAGIKHYNTSHPSLSKQLCSDQLIQERQGYITSPGYPEAHPNRISCSWHIYGEVGDVVTLVFEDLDIKESGACAHPPCCVFNWLKLSPSFNGTERQYCGQDDTYHPTFVSTTNKVWVKFHINTALSTGRGFKLSFTVGSPDRVTCLQDEFRCRNGICVLPSARCNGFSECGDGSDEEFCSAFCPTGRSCNSMWFCYEEKKHCDGITDCLDLSDEIGCNPCSANETRCGSDSDECYNPLTQRCNRVMDCTNGVDERGCLHTCPDKIMCASGTGCYVPEERCNGISQCSDSSDEKNCGADLCNYERGGFLCGNGHCIREMWKCDRTNDCGDGTDEYNCLRNSVLTAAITGSLICALLLVIAVSCTCRLYALRALENRMSSRESTVSRMSPEFLFREPPPSYAVAVGEHQRSLYVENVHHYNPCPRRGRRRIRRARRHQEGRRGSVSLLDNMVHQNRTLRGPPLNYPFPCLPVNATTRSPSPETSRTSSSNTSSTATCISIVSSSEADCCWDTDQNISEGPQPQNIRISNVVSTDINLELDKDKQEGATTSTNAESSFSELPTVHKKPKDKTKVRQEMIHHHNISSVLLIPGNLASPQAERQHQPVSLNQRDSYPPVVIGSEDQQHNHSNTCDTDTQPLIT